MSNEHMWIIESTDSTNTTGLRVGDRVSAPTDLDILDYGTVVGIEDRHGRVRVRWDDSGMLTDVRPRDLTVMEDTEHMWIIESTDSTNTTGWSESACGDTGPGLTQFVKRGAAEAAARSLVALGEGWTHENVRVRMEVAS